MPAALQDTINISEHLPAADTIIMGSSDSLPMISPLIPDAATVYGVNSEKIVQVVSESAVHTEPLTGNIWFQILSLIVLALYCWMIYYFRHQIVMCIKGVFNFKSEEKFTAEHGVPFDKFLDYATAVMVISIGIMGTKLMAVTLNTELLTAVPSWIMPLVSLIVATAIVAIIAFQFAVLKAAGNLTMSSELMKDVVQAKKLYLAAAAVLIVPFILLYTGFAPIWDKILMYIIMGEGITITMIFVAKTFLLFMRQKVSLLVWILYLCAVEIFPLSLVTLLVLKNI